VRATASLRKSVTDLTRRRARAFFTVLTLALAVASVGVLALAPLMERAMNREVEASRLSDVTLSMSPQQLDADRLEALASLPNVEAVEPRSTYLTRVWVGERRERAIVIGVEDFARQQADVVRVSSGAAPGAGALLTDRNNASRKGFEPAAGEQARLIGADGRDHRLPITGVGQTLTKGETDPTNDWITFYAAPETVAALSGAAGYTSLGLRLARADRPAAEQTIAAVRDELRATTDFRAFSDLPVIQEPGSYPGKENFESLASLFTIITLLALLSALVLMSNTMTTLVGEQAGEIAAMKAIGARRRDIRRIYLRTALVLGAMGAVLGAALGVLVANALVGFFASLFFGIDAGFGVSVPVVAACLVVGVVGPPLAALPAVRRAARLPLNETLQAAGAPLAADGRLDSALRRVRVLPRSMQIGLRGIARRKRRTLATVTQISLAVATLLALLSLGAGVGETTRGWFDDNHFDIWVEGAASKPLDPAAGRLIARTEGVERAQPWLHNQADVGEQSVEAWGLPHDPTMNTRITAGRWHTPEEVARAEPVAVLGPTIAKTTGSEVGDEVRLSTSSGTIPLRVIGVSANQAANGDVVFLPVSTLGAALGERGLVNSYWVTTTSRDHGFIDRTTTRLEDSLVAEGNEVATLVNHDAREEQVAANGQITTSVTVLGLLVVAISMVALINALTMAVLERTREIGMLRSVGARARDVRGIFATEGVAAALAGWLAGVPIGYGLARAIGWASGEAVGLDIVFVFPLGYVALALAGTIALAVLVMLAPLRRAVRLKPGDALRFR
jgi:putative ABC transport system permease protein